MVYDKYDVILSPLAYEDLDNIYNGVLQVSQDLDTAKEYLAALKEKILGLEDNPQIHPIRKYGIFANKGYRYTDYKKYTIIFKILDDTKEVLVITICLTSADV
ncbi:Plasmid stabilization system protein ParE [Lachnospiraceae bacterium NE2001]|nr:Plasmid stabilization system protein ParE [Lachnospiraceae bacterium NE2001]